MDTLELYFADLTPEAQTRVLEFYNIKSPESLNWDVVPLATLVLADD